MSGGTIINRTFGFFWKKLKRKLPVLKDPGVGPGVKILFLHQSTGRLIWESGVVEWFDEYNRRNGTNYTIVEQVFPKPFPYDGGNYPYDYWKIWVENADEKPYKREPTLEMISKRFDMVILKHCFPVSNISEGKERGSLGDPTKTLGNYKIHYNALKEKMLEFPDTKFLVWTGAAQVKDATTEEKAKRAAEFSRWVKEEWDERGDNIFIWDFRELETDGGLYMKDEFAISSRDSHPNESFSKSIYPLFSQRIVDVIEGKGDDLPLTGWHGSNH